MAGDRRVDRRTMGEPWRMGREGEGDITGDEQREIRMQANVACVKIANDERDAAHKSRTHRLLPKCKQTEAWNELAMSIER